MKHAILTLTALIVTAFALSHIHPQPNEARGIGGQRFRIHDPQQPKQPKPRPPKVVSAASAALATGGNKVYQLKDWTWTNHK